MNRRGFLGSLIGSVMALPFFARLESEEWQMPDCFPYKMLFKGNGKIIQAPAIVKVVKLDYGVSFQAGILEVTQFIEVDRAILLTDKGQMIRECKFYPAHMCSGDTLAVTIHLNCNTQATLEEMIEAASKSIGGYTLHPQRDWR